MVVPKILHYAVELRAVRPKVDFSRPPVVYTNDLRSAEFQFEITDMSVADLSTATATTLLYMRDGSFFQNPKEDVSLVGTTFSYTLKENEGNHAGIAKIQLIVTIGEAEYATQLYEFEIINGLETKVAQEVMIYDWTMLTREARDYIDQFVADELLRDAEFDNNEFDRNTAFIASQDARTVAFGMEQTNRGTAFTAEQNERTTAFNESESGRTTAENGRVTAEDGRVIAENNRVTKEGQRVTAETNRVTAEGNRVTAESGRVTAENARVTAETNRAAAFTAFDTRLAAEETATANNKISAVKGKTFADVDARIEDVETDTTMMGTNKVTNGDFLNGITGWTTSNSYTLVTNGIRLTFTSGTNALLATNLTANALDVLYIKANIDTDISNGVWAYSNGELPAAQLFNGKGSLLKLTNPLTRMVFGRNTATGTYLEIKLPLIINLTATFGKGNEPTVEQMDAIMSKFTNSWFDGTKNLFRASETLKKQIAIDARTEFEMKNTIANGDFSNGAAGWSAGGAILSVSNNTLSVTGSGANGTPQGVPDAKLLTQDGTTRLLKFKVRVTNSDCQKISIFVGGTEYIVTSNPIANQWYSFTKLFTFENSKMDAYLAIRHTYIDATTANGKVMEVQHVSFIDLTAAFGAGKEPTLTEMDRLMARFPNSWFDGVKPVQTIETLYQEKANKVQEAWITPTLLNGATGTVQYRKNEFNTVEFRGYVTGTAGQPLFTMPTGYKPYVACGSTCRSTSSSTSIFLLGTNGSAYIEFPYSTQTAYLNDVKYSVI